jgi:hypothetical protein
MRKTLEHTAVRTLFCGFVLSLALTASDPATARTKWERSRGGLGALMELARDRGDMQEEYERDTENFEKISGAVRNDILRKGYKSFEISKKFGEPVIKMPEDKGGNTVWLYKPSEGWFIDNVPKVSLEFDPAGKLVRAEYIPRRPEKEKKGEGTGGEGEVQDQ